MERFEFSFSSSTVEPPTGSQIRLNTTDPAAATKAWIRNITGPGEDVYWLLINITPGDVIYLQDYDDHSKGVVYTTTGPPIDKTTYVELPVTVKTTLDPLLTQKISVSIIKASEEPAPGPGPPLGTVAYATIAELARVLELRAPSGAQTDAMDRCLTAATYEVDSYIGHDTQYLAPYPPLAVEVTLERAVEHWSQSFTPYGVFQASGVPILTARDTFIRHAHKLLPLKESFGIA